MNNYELTVILRNSNPESSKEKIRETLLKHNINITGEDEWGTKKLAYEIDKEKEGFYILLNIEASPDSIKKINSDFNLNTEILRFLFVKLKTQKSA